MFGVRAREQDRDRVQVIAGQATHPVVGMIGSGITQNVRTRRHALTELLGESGQRLVGHTERPQAVPGERQRDPPL